MSKTVKTKFKIITYIIIACFLYENFLWAGVCSQSKLSPPSILKLAEKYKGKGHDIYIKTVLLDEFLRDSNTREYIFSKKRLPNMPKGLEGLFEVSHSQTLKIEENKISFNVRFGGLDATLYFFKDKAKAELDPAAGIDEKDLPIIKDRGYWFNISEDAILYAKARDAVMINFEDVRKGSFRDAAKSIQLTDSYVTMEATAWVEGVKDFHSYLPTNVIIYEDIVSSSNISTAEFDKLHYVDFINTKLRDFFGTDIPKLTAEQIVIVKSIYGDREIKGEPAKALPLFNKIVIEEKALADKKKLEWILVHETIHLIFPGLDIQYLNEAITEWLTENVMGTPSWGGYADRVKVLRLILEEEKTRKSLINAYKTGDLTVFRREIGDEMFVILIHLDLFELSGYLCSSLISQDVLEILKKRLKLQKEINRRKLLFDEGPTAEEMSLLLKLDEAIRKLTEKRLYIRQRHITLADLSLEDLRGIITPAIRSHRFPKIIKGKDFYAAFKQNLISAGISPTEAERILVQGLKRITPEGVVEESPQVKEIARQTLSLILEKEITMFAMDQVLDYHEELHRIIIEEDVKNVKDNIIKEMGEESYELLKRYFQNLYGEYSDEFELIEELIVTMYTEQVLDNLLRLLPDKDNPGSLIVYKEIERFRNLGRIVKRSIKSYRSKEIFVRRILVTDNLAIGRVSKAGIYESWKQSRDMLQRIIDTLSAGELKIILRLWEVDMKSKAVMKGLLDEWEEIRNKYRFLGTYGAESIREAIAETDGLDLIREALQPNEEERQPVNGKYPAKSTGDSPGDIIRSILGGLEEGGSLEELLASAGQRFNERLAIAPGEFIYLPLVRRLIATMQDLLSFYGFSSKPIVCEIDKSSLVMSFGLDMSKLKISGDDPLHAWYKSKSDINLDLKVVFKRGAVEVELIYRINGIHSEELLGAMPMYIPVTELTDDKDIEKINSNIRFFLRKGIRKVCNFYSVNIHESFKMELFDAFIDSLRRLATGNAFFGPEYLERPNYWMAQGYSLEDAELLSEMYLDCCYVVWDLFLDRFKQTNDAWRRNERIDLLTFKYLKDFLYQLISYFDKLNELRIIDSIREQKGADGWIKIPFIHLFTEPLNIMISSGTTDVKDVKDFYVIDGVVSDVFRSLLIIIQRDDLGMESLTENLPGGLQEILDNPDSINSLPISDENKRSLKTLISFHIRDMSDTYKTDLSPRLINLIMNEILIVKETAKRYGYLFETNINVLKFIQLRNSKGIAKGKTEEGVLLELLGIFAKKIHSSFSDTRTNLSNKGRALKALGFPPDSNPAFEEIKKQYRRIAFQLHPDRADIKGLADEARAKGLEGEAIENYIKEKIIESETKLKEVNDAYQYLESSSLEKGPDSAWIYKASPDTVITPLQRKFLEQYAHSYLKFAGETGRIIRLKGPGINPGSIEAQTKRYIENYRLNPSAGEKTSADLMKALEYINSLDMDGLENTAIAAVIHEYRNAAPIGFSHIGTLNSPGFMALTAIGGRYPYEGAGEQPYTIYMRLDDILAYMELGDEGRQALIEKLRHEKEDAERKLRGETVRHVDEPQEIISLINGIESRILQNRMSDSYDYLETAGKLLRESPDQNARKAVLDQITGTALRHNMDPLDFMEHFLADENMPLEACLYIIDYLMFVFSQQHETLRKSTISALGIVLGRPDLTNREDCMKVTNSLLIIFYDRENLREQIMYIFEEALKNKKTSEISIRYIISSLSNIERAGVMPSNLPPIAIAGFGSALHRTDLSAECYYELVKSMTWYGLRYEDFLQDAKEIWKDILTSADTTFEACERSSFALVRGCIREKPEWSEEISGFFKQVLTGEESNINALLGITIAFLREDSGLPLSFLSLEEGLRNFFSRCRGSEFYGNLIVRELSRAADEESKTKQIDKKRKDVLEQAFDYIISGSESPITVAQQYMDIPADMKDEHGLLNDMAEDGFYLGDTAESKVTEEDIAGWKGMLAGIDLKDGTELTIGIKKFTIVDIGDGRFFAIDDMILETIPIGIIRMLLLSSKECEDLKDLSFGNGPIILTACKRSAHPFGDCIGNRVMFINEAFLKLYNEMNSAGMKEEAGAILQLGLEHELLHELRQKGREIEQELLNRDLERFSVLFGDRLLSAVEYFLSIGILDDFISQFYRLTFKKKTLNPVGINRIVLSSDVSGHYLLKGRDDKEVIIPPHVIRKLKQMADLSRELEVELPARVEVRHGVAIKVFYPDDAGKIAIIKTDRRDEANNNLFYDVGTYFLNTAAGYISGQGKGELSIQNILRTCLSAISMDHPEFDVSKFNIDDISFRIFSASHGRHYDISPNELVQQLNSGNQEIKRDLQNIKYIAAKWWSRDIIFSSPYFFSDGFKDAEKSGIEWLLIHRHPNKCPSPPSALPNEQGDIYADGFMQGKMHGLILDDNGQDILFAFYEPDDSRKEEYIRIFEKFWSNKQPVFDDLGKIAMQAHGLYTADFIIDNIAQEIHKKGSRDLLLHLDEEGRLQIVGTNDNALILSIDSTHWDIFSVNLKGRKDTKEEFIPKDASLQEIKALLYQTLLRKELIAKDNALSETNLDKIEGISPKPEQGEKISISSKLLIDNVKKIGDGRFEFNQQASGIKYLLEKIQSGFFVEIINESGVRKGDLEALLSTVFSIEKTKINVIELGDAKKADYKKGIVLLHEDSDTDLQAFKDKGIKVIIGKRGVSVNVLITVGIYKLLDINMSEMKDILVSLGYTDMQAKDIISSGLLILPPVTSILSLINDVASFRRTIDIAA